MSRQGMSYAAAEGFSKLRKFMSDLIYLFRYNGVSRLNWLANP
jgi:hypothetical protein